MIKAAGAELVVISPRSFLRVPEDAGEHCHEEAMLRFHQVTFDWLDETLNQK
jgi:hypothetical protein